MKFPLRSLLVSFLALACSAGAVAQISPALDNAATTGKDGKRYVAYRITRGDILSVGVLGEPDLTAAQKRVESVGTINLQLVGDIRLVGRTLKEAQEAIETAYSEGRFLRNPKVSVVVETYAPRAVRVSGKVNTQGSINIPADTEFTIVDVIVKANGLSETARGKEVKLTRTLPDGTTRVFTLDVESVLKARGRTNEPAAVFMVEPDDIIYVPEKLI